MLKIEVKIKNIWRTLNPEFNGFKITKYRIIENPLQVRYECSGTLSLFGEDYDLLIDYINIYNIECRITESVNGDSVYLAFLNLDYKQDFTTEFITATIAIIDDYYSFYDESKINAETKFKINELIENHIFIINKITSWNTTGTSYFTQNSYKLKDILQYIITEISGINTFDFDFLKYFDEILIVKKDILSGISYCQNRDAMMKSYYDDAEFYSNLNSTIIDNTYEVSLNDVMRNFMETMSFFWYIENNTFIVKNFKDFVFSNGINLINYLGVDWEEENKKILEYNKTKISNIIFSNSNTKYYARFLNPGIPITYEYIWNPFYSKEYIFENLKLNKKEISYSNTVDFTNPKKENDYTYNMSSEWKKKSIGDGLLNTNISNFIDFNKKELLEYSDGYDGQPERKLILNGDAFLRTEFSELQVLLNSTITVNFKKDTIGAKHFGTKWQYLKSGQTFSIDYTTLEQLYSGHIYLMRNNGYAVKDKSILWNEAGSHTLSYTIQITGYYYFLFQIYTGSGVFRTIKDISVYATGEVFELNNTELELTPYISLNVYNYKFSLDYILQNFTTEFSEVSGIKKNLQNNESENVVGLIKKNDKTQIIQAPINENITNIDFSEKMYTDSLGWARVDKIEREYNKDFNSFCMITLTNN